MSGMFCSNIWRKQQHDADRYVLTVARFPSLIIRFSVRREKKTEKKNRFRGESSITPPPQMPYTVPTGRLSMPRDALGPSVLIFP